MMPLLIAQILRVFIRVRPKLVMAMGGGICVPFAMIAWCLRIPVIAFEQNAIPGRATRAIQFFSKKIISAFELTKTKLIMTSKVDCLGNPIRLNYPIEDRLPAEWDKIQGATLLIIGGSQGSAAINEFIVAHRQAILGLGVHIIHLTGKHFLKGQNQVVQTVENYRYIALPYLNNMAIAYQKATCVLCRSGATTLSEIHYHQIPSLLVPFPLAMDNHQEINAIEFSKLHKYVTHVQESELSFNHISNLVSSKRGLAHDAIYPQASKDVNIICELIKSYLE